MATETLQSKAASKREAWIASVRDLCCEIAAWCEAERWFVDVHERRLREEEFGDYVLPELFVKAPGCRFTVEPVAGEIVGADGRVDIRAFPSDDRMLLIRRGEEWEIWDDLRERRPGPWGRESFLAIVEELTAA